jgi:hypothetical protein
MDCGGNTSPIDADHRHREYGRGKRAAIGTGARPSNGFGRTATGACAVAERSLPARIFRKAERGGRGKSAAAKVVVGLTDQTLSCAARAQVAAAERRAACLHVKGAMQAA